MLGVVNVKGWPRDRYTGPGGGLYTGPGGGLYTGPCDNPYRSILPPDEILFDYLKKTNQKSILELLIRVGYFN